VRLLEVGGIVQSGTYLDERYTELVFEYLKRYDLLFNAERPIERICVLGCGGYDYPEHLIAHHDAVTVDAVEIDPTITEIAQHYFFLDRLVAEFDLEENGRLNLINADAADYLASCEIRYDAIVNDTFDAGTPPPHLTTPAFAHLVHERLTDGGVFLTNIVSPLEGPDASFLRDQVALFEREFAHVYVVPCATDTLTEPDNVVVIATDGTISDVPARPLR
jgi:spermidine synthase